MSAAGRSGTQSVRSPEAAIIPLVGADALSTAPARDATAMIVRAARPDNVDLVMIDGVVLKRDGNLVQVDAESVIAEADSRISRLRAQAGL